MNAYLRDFLFSNERARSPVKALSGGERNRLLLARLFTRPANVLVLDEPTNDLDIETLELLEEELVEWPGTLLLVSHDRAFLDNVVTSTFVFEGDGRVQRVRRRLRGLGAAAAATRKARGRGRRAGKRVPASDARPRTGFREDDQDRRAVRQEAVVQGTARARRAAGGASTRSRRSSARSPPGSPRRNSTKKAARRSTQALARVDTLASELAVVYDRWHALEARGSEGDGMHAAVLIGAGLTDTVVVQPFGRGAASAVDAGLEAGKTRVARALDQRAERVPQRALGQTPPLEHADAARLRGELERCLPDAGELGHDDAGVGQQDDDVSRVAADELNRTILVFLAIDRGLQVRTEKRDELLVAFGRIHEYTHYGPAATRRTRARHASGRIAAPNLSAGRVLAIATQFDGLSLFLAVLAAEFPVRAALRDLAGAGGVSTLGGVGHRGPPAAFYAQVAEFR